MRSLRYLNKFFWKYRLRLFSGIFFMIMSTFFSLLPVKMLGEGIDYATLATDPEVAAAAGLSREDVLAELLIYGLLIIGYTLVFGFFLFLNRQTIIVMSRLIEYDLKNEIYAHYQRLDQSFYKRNNTGDLMNRISEDVNRVRMYLGPAIMYATTTIIALVMTIVFMLSEDVRLTLYVLAPLPVLALSIYWVSNRINKKSLKVQAQLSRLSTLAQETFSGIRVVKAFAREEKIQQTWEEESTKYKK